MSNPPTPAERRAVAEIVLPGRDMSEHAAFERGCGFMAERFFLEDGLLRARIASRIEITHDIDRPWFCVTAGTEHALVASNDANSFFVFNERTLLDALWACALAHVREVERRKAEAKQPDPTGERVRHRGLGEGTVTGTDDRGRLLVRFDAGLVFSVAREFVVSLQPPPPAPRRFFPGERVVHSYLGRGIVRWIPSDAQTYFTSIEVAFGDGMLHMVRPEDIAPETAARVIPYGGTA